MTTLPALSLGFVIPGDIHAPTGGSRYDREVLARFPSHGIQAKQIAVSGHYPRPTAQDRHHTAAVVSGASCDCLLIDGLAFGAFSDIEINALTKPCLVLLHHPLADETGLATAIAQHFYQQEKRNLQYAQAVIVTSLQTQARLIDHYNVAAQRISVAEPAISKPQSLLEKLPTNIDRPCKMLAVGSISPRKNYAQLLNALSQITTKRPWSLQIAGRCDDHAETQKLTVLIKNFGLQNHIILCDAVDELELVKLYKNSDFLLFPSLYEGYGMVLTEALSYELPVLASTRIPSAASHRRDAVVCLDPTLPALWTKAIELWINDSDAFTNAVKAAKQAARSLQDWDQTTQQIVHAVMRVMAAKTGSS